MIFDMNSTSATSASLVFPIFQNGTPPPSAGPGTPGLGAIPPFIEFIEGSDDDQAPNVIGTIGNTGYGDVW